MINKELAEQSVDELLSTGDESLHRFGGCTFRSQTSEAANGVCSHPILNEIAALESKFGGVSYAFFESAISLVDSRLAQWENDRRKLIQQVKELSSRFVRLKLAELNDGESN